MSESTWPVDVSGGRKSEEVVTETANKIVLASDMNREEFFTFSCLFCPFSVVEESSLLLEHMINEHSVLVADAKDFTPVAFSVYCSLWKSAIENRGLQPSSICATIESRKSPVTPTAEGSYYLLSDILAEDQAFRRRARESALQIAIQQQQKERTDLAFEGRCVFCRQRFGSRVELFAHMFKVHGFNVGHPDNLVFTDRLVALLQRCLGNLKCLFCEKKFDSYDQLKLHMRKKKHVRIDPSDRQFDQFYMINYLNKGRPEVACGDNSDTYSEESGAKDEEVSRWSDWEEDETSNSSKLDCLFCSESMAEKESLFTHMKESHCFDFCAFRRDLALDFYGTVRMINFVRRMRLQKICLHCRTEFPSVEELTAHAISESHESVPKDPSLWSDVLYLFPTNENDLLLTAFDDNFSDDEGDSDG